MIITRLAGGLGNQMFQYAVAKALAARNNDSFKMDISFYPKQTLRKYELSLFNIEENIASEEECVELRGKEDFWFKLKSKLGLSIRRPVAYREELAKELTFFQESIFYLKGDVYLSGFWQNEAYFKSIREQLLANFTSKQNICEKAKSLLEMIKSSNSVSLHVRRGDYVKNKISNLHHGVCDIDYLKKAMAIIDMKVENPKYFIFSDDIEWCEEQISFLENKVFVTKTKNAVEDLELMRFCRHNIIANSTFSWWGAWLNTNVDKLVIAPSRWFAYTDKCNILPQEWIKV